MSLADEIERLQRLHEQGALTAEEFAAAKQRAISGPGAEWRFEAGDSLGDAAKTWVTFQIVMGVIGFILAAVVFFGFMLPKFREMPGGFRMMGDPQVEFHESP